MADILRVITPARMRQIEQAYMRETGTPGLLLMERAAQAVADAAYGMTGEGAVFLCGPGNNGGDGYAAARLFHEKGRSAWVWAFSDPAALKGDARTNLLRCEELSIPIHPVKSLPQAPPGGCGVIVDALFGTGQDRPLSGLYADAAHWINVSALPVLAVDMPSGLPDAMIRADKTVTFHRMKPSHLLYPGRANAGRVSVVDIGLPDIDTPEEYEVLQPSDFPTILPARAPDAHKGDCGRVLLLAGSYGMAGAAALSANAAIRGGAGLVTVACPEEILPIVQTLAPCATCAAPERFPELLPQADAVACGPGLGNASALSALLERLLIHPGPQVWDADALNWLAAHPILLDDRFVLTPHPGEAARLLDCTVSQITADPLVSADQLAERYGAVILLKGATTVLSGAGRKALNSTGSPGLATGGSGDVLTGLIAAFLAQGLSPFDAAQLGALAHGIAGEAAAARYGVRSMNAMDLLQTLRIE